MVEAPLSRGKELLGQQACTQPPVWNRYIRPLERFRSLGLGVDHDFCITEDEAEIQRGPGTCSISKELRWDKSQHLQCQYSPPQSGLQQKLWLTYRQAPCSWDQAVNKLSKEPLNKKGDAGQMARTLREHTSLKESLKWIHSSHVEWLKTLCNSFHGV